MKRFKKVSLLYIIVVVVAIMGLVQLFHEEAWAIPLCNSCPTDPTVCSQTTWLCHCTNCPSQVVQCRQACAGQCCPWIEQVCEFQKHYYTRSSGRRWKTWNRSTKRISCCLRLFWLLQFSACFSCSMKKLMRGRVELVFVLAPVHALHVLPHYCAMASRFMTVVRGVIVSSNSDL